MANNNKAAAARTSPEVRISYPTLFTPRSFQPGQTAKYGIVLMLDKKNQDHMAFLKALYADAQQVMTEHWPDPAKRPRKDLKTTLFKDGDMGVGNDGIPFKEKNPEYEGHWFVRANSTQKPVVVDANRQEILDANKVYGGCYCKVNLNIYTFATDTNKGVTAGLNGVQFMKDGESFGGGRPPLNDMFQNEGGASGSDPFAGEGGGDPFAGGGVDDDIPF